MKIKHHLFFKPVFRRSKAFCIFNDILSAFAVIIAEIGNILCFALYYAPLVYAATLSDCVRLPLVRQKQKRDLPLQVPYFPCLLEQEQFMIASCFLPAVEHHAIRVHFMIPIFIQAPYSQIRFHLCQIQTVNQQSPHPHKCKEQ